MPVIALILENIPRGQSHIARTSLRVRAIWLCRGEYFPVWAITGLLHSEKYFCIKNYEKNNYRG